MSHPTTPFLRELRDYMVANVSGLTAANLSMIDRPDVKQYGAQMATILPAGGVNRHEVLFEVQTRGKTYLEAQALALTVVNGIDLKGQFLTPSYKVKWIEGRQPQYVGRVEEELYLFSTQYTANILVR